MNDSFNPNRPLDVSGTTRDPGQRVPDTSMLPGSEKAPPAAVGVLKNAVQGAHHTIDRLADSAEPAVRQVSDSVAAAGASLHAKADQLREVRHEWAEEARTTVRGNPLVAVAAAFALGAVIARITR